MAAVDELITEHIDIWTSAVKRKSSAGRGGGKKVELYGVKKLRELILDLAVRGLLVPQDPEDEPASVLLERIAVERAELLDSGSLKKQKPLPDIDIENVPHNLPKTWAVERFGRLSIIERGGSPRPIKSFITNDPDGLNWIKIGDTDIGGKYINSTQEKITKDGLKKTRMVFPGDFLLTNSMSFGRPYITNIEGCIHDGWLRISPTKYINKDYLYSLLSSPYIVRAFTASAAGAVVQNLNSEKVREVLIFVPPLQEQHRIVAKVDELMALCDQLEQQSEASLTAHQTLVKTLLDALTQEAASQPNNPQSASDAPTSFEQAWNRLAEHFDTVFTTEDSIEQLKHIILQLAVMGKLVPQDPNDEPASVLLERIAAEKAELVKAKKIKKQKALPVIGEEEKPFELPAGWEWCRFGTCWQDSFYGPRFGKNEYVDQGGYPTIRTTDMTPDGRIELNSPPSVIVEKEKLELYGLMAGDLLITRSGSIGTMAVFDLDCTAIPSAYLIRVRLPKQLHPECMLLMLMSPLGKKYLGINTTAVGVPNVNASKMAEFIFAIPPLKEQNRIVSKVRELMTHCERLKAFIIDLQASQLQISVAVTEHAIHQK